jgi:hypothetical protein
LREEGREKENVEGRLRKIADGKVSNTKVIQ